MHCNLASVDACDESENDYYQDYKEMDSFTQYDSLIENFTGSETMNLLGIARGVPKDQINNISENLAIQLNFCDSLDRKIIEYNKVNKRKLIIALALYDNTSVVYLDESITKMDLISRRYAFNTVCNARNNGSIVVLNSSYVEDCELLCTRIAFMVNGKLLCIGSPQHLINKISQGITIVIKAFNKLQ